MKYTTQQKEQLITLLRDGKHMFTACRTSGIPISYGYRIAQMNGIKMERKRGGTHITWTQEMDSLLGKITDSEFSRRFSVAVSTIRNRRNFLGLGYSREINNEKQKEILSSIGDEELLNEIALSLSAKYGISGRLINNERIRRFGMGGSWKLHRLKRDEEFRRGSILRAAIAGMYYSSNPRPTLSQMASVLSLSKQRISQILEEIKGVK